MRSLRGFPPVPAQSGHDLLQVVTQVALTATKTDGYAHFFKEGA